MAVSRDAAGNLYARPGGAVAGAEIWSGSHLDTVPSGGRFDGALGVVAALEAVAAVAADRPEAPLAVVVFRDEEGWRFGQGCFGSRCVVGDVGPDDLAERDSAGVSAAEALAALGLAGPPVDMAPPAAYVEVHIEQGPILDAADMPLGRRGRDRRDGRLHGDLPRRVRACRDGADERAKRRLHGVR